MNTPSFTPALGRSEFTGLYDRMIALMTREHIWRAKLLDALEPKDGETIVDLGAGTGSLGILIKQRKPAVRVVAVDPDPEVRAIGEAKARRFGIELEYLTTMGDAPLGSVPYGTADAVTSSLVLHQCPLDAKRAILENAFRLLRQGGRLVLADYGVQPGVFMSAGFLLVQMLDGFEATRHNKKGVIPALIEHAGFRGPENLAQVRTFTGAITIWRAAKDDA